MGFVSDIFGGGQVKTPEPPIIPASPVEEDEGAIDREAALRERQRRLRQTSRDDLRIQPGVPRRAQSGLSIYGQE